MKKINNDLGGLVALTLFLSAIFYPTSVHASLFGYKFSTDGILKESGSMQESSSPYWWLNSGAYLLIKNGRGYTVQSDLPDTDLFNILYNRNNATDTDQGFHPQNIFRLVTKDSGWQNLEQEVYFKIIRNNFSLSPNRNQSNGLLLFNRYVDGDNLYYTGVRVDGAAIIKKKQGGVYYTLDYKPEVYPGVYNSSSNPNLLPTDRWIGLRSRLENVDGGKVRIRLYLDRNWNDRWELIAEAYDNGKYGTPISGAGSAGIRTDFMDVMFDGYHIRNL